MNNTMEIRLVLHISINEKYFNFLIKTQMLQLSTICIDQDIHTDPCQHITSASIASEAQINNMYFNYTSINTLQQHFRKIITPIGNNLLHTFSKHKNVIRYVM
eukprot:392704_1